MLKIIGALLTTATLLTATPSFADARLANQDRRIDVGRRDGELSRGEAWRLHRTDGRIAREERRDLRRNGGYLTRHEARRIGRQENRVSRRIYRERRGY